MTTAAVFPPDLEWEDLEVDEGVSEALSGKRIVEVRVFVKHDREALIAIRTENQSAVGLKASSNLNDLDPHNVTRVFCSDENGRVVEGVPSNLVVEQVVHQKATSSDRECMCCGYKSNTASLNALLIKFQSSTTTIRLHCWTQCKAYQDGSFCGGGCGDPHVPCYNRISMVQPDNPRFCREGNSFGALCEAFGRSAPPSSMLSPDFLGAVRCFGTMFCFDASGFRPLQAHFELDTVGGIYVSISRAFSARSDLAGPEARLVNFEVSVNSLLSLPKKPFRLLEMLERTENKRCFMVLEGSNWDEIKTTPAETLLTNQLALLRKPSRPRWQLVCWSVNDIHALVTYAFDRGEASLQQTSRSLSLRVTFPCSFFRTRATFQAIQRSVSSRVVQHSKASLGYHLVSSSEGRLVVTLHGSPSQLASDIPILEEIRSQQSNAFQPTQYAVLRIVGPSKLDISALLASGLDELCCDGNNRAIYSSMHFSNHGNAEWEVAVPFVKKFLGNLLRLEDNQSDASHAWKKTCLKKLKFSL